MEDRLFCIFNRALQNHNYIFTNNTNTHISTKIAQRTKTANRLSEPDLHSAFMNIRIYLQTLTFTKRVLYWPIADTSLIQCWMPLYAST